MGLFVALAVSGNAAAQPLKATLKFLSDTTTIGTPVKVSVTFKHPIAMTVIFPDSAYDFSPFEFISKEYFKTKSDSIASTDSAVYTLNTFEILPYLSLSLPLIYVEGEDSSDFYTNTDEIFLDETIKTMPQQPSIKENTVYRPVDIDFNYPYLLIGLGALTLIIGGVVLFFRKRITRSIRLYFIKKQFEKFIGEFDRQKDSVSPANAKESLETVLSLWKKYLEKLEGLPYTTYTSREIVRSIEFNKLYDSLLNLDRCIYGGFYSDDVHKSLRTLRETAYSRYQKKTHELKHA
ncbi:MAG: hypothetical protein K2Q22_04885 [Cytophagales bacterium]|nr:hypothetical protein [Cytophagales bacterium]